VFTDLQVGSYVFMDVQYNAVTRRDGTSGPFRTSLFVQSTVISANVAGRATTDAGYKAFAMDGPPPP
jgi:D-serine deaminase-like pyridoxal phosphate-dependent protein